MRAAQIYTKFNQDLLFQIRISARVSKINDMVVRQRRNKQTHPSRDLLGRCAAAAQDRGRKTTGEGGAGRASKAGGRGRRRPEGESGRRRERASGRAALGRRPDGEQRGVVRGGRRERSRAGRGDFFSSLLLGLRRTNPIRTSPPG